MASYNAGRKAPNVSHYLANLNALPSPHDVATQQDENFRLDDDLAQFTNAEFLDFDAGADFLDHTLPDFDASHSQQSRRSSSGHHDAKALEFSAFNFADISSFPLDQTSTIVPPLQAQYMNTSISNGASASFYASPTTTTLSTQFNPAPYPGQRHSRSPSTPLSASGPHSQEPETAASRMAAEEDKRRRNTAASARFRVKKKQREQALELAAKELENKVNGLEQRIGQLETENEWLRGLVVEKNGGEKDDLKIKWKLRDCSAEDERRSGKGKKGVGTTASAAEGTEELTTT